MLADSCLGFQIACETMLKGGLAVIMAFVLFVGSVLIVLSAVFGRRMGYLVLAVSFFGWMIILSSLWTFGFFSQGLDTPVNLGPRGAEPAWVVESAGTDPEPVYPAFATYPGDDLARTRDERRGHVLGPVRDGGGAGRSSPSRRTRISARASTSPGALTTTDFTVQNVEFYPTDDGVSLAAAHAFFNDGGPMLTVYLRHDSGSVNRYSWMFLIGSTLLFGAHLPFLDRAERKRKEILTGGTAPPWYGPA